MDVKENNPPPERREIPLAVEKAAEMTDGEFQKIRTQNRLIWIVTFFGASLGVGAMFMGIGIGIIPNGVLGGVAFHALGRMLFKNGNKAGSARYQKYKSTFELNKYRSSTKE